MQSCSVQNACNLQSSSVQLGLMQSSLMLAVTKHGLLHKDTAEMHGAGGKPEKAYRICQQMLQRP